VATFRRPSGFIIAGGATVVAVGEGDVDVG
jgi:hypothetical protein